MGTKQMVFPREFTLVATYWKNKGSILFTSLFFHFIILNTINLLAIKNTEIYLSTVDHFTNHSDLNRNRDMKLAFFNI